MDADALQAIITIAGDIRINNNVSIASLTFLIYDILLTLPDEVEYIWKARWSLVKVLYLINRYCTLANQSAGIPFWFMVNPTLNYCKYFFLIDVWFTYAFALPTQIVIGMRTYAFFAGVRSAKLVISTMFFLTFFTVVGSFILYTVSTKFANPGLTGVVCLFYITSSPRAAQIMAFGAAALYELLCWVMSAYRVYQFAREGESKLIRLMFRDSLMFFTLVTLAATINIFLWAFIPPKHGVLQSVLANFTQTIGSIISARILLHLRRFAREEEVFGIGGEAGRRVRVRKRDRDGNANADGKKGGKKGRKEGSDKDLDGWGELSVGWETWDVEGRRRGVYGEEGRARGGGGGGNGREGELTTLEFGKAEGLEMSVSLGPGPRGETTTSNLETGDESQHHHTSDSSDVESKGKRRPSTNSDSHDRDWKENAKGLAVPKLWGSSSQSDLDTSGTESSQLRSATSGVSGSSNEGSSGPHHDSSSRGPSLP